MATFELSEGERLLEEHEVSFVDGPKAVQSRLVLTSHRVVVIAHRKRTFVEAMFGLVGRVISQLLDVSNQRITCEIPRERFASVEPGEGKVIIFRDDGEGYAHTSFAILSERLTNNEPFSVWQHRMHAWAAGTLPAAPLPDAKLHNSRN